MLPIPHRSCTSTGQAMRGSVDWRYRLNKSGPEIPDKVGSTDERGFTLACVSFWGQDILPIWYPQVETTTIKK